VVVQAETCVGSARLQRFRLSYDSTAHEVFYQPFSTGLSAVNCFKNNTAWMQRVVRETWERV
jgi:hypothetical protein